MRLGKPITVFIEKYTSGDIDPNPPQLNPDYMGILVYCTRPLTAARSAQRRIRVNHCVQYCKDTSDVICLFIYLFTARDLSLETEKFILQPGFY